MMIAFRPLTLVAALLAALLLPAVYAQDPAARGPRPELDPPQVVEAMLAALKKNSDEGIAELFEFSSPGNRANTGPLEQFRVLIREGFPDMLGHQAARSGAPLIDGDRAMMPVEIIGSDNLTHRYVFLLSRQNLPECAGCWMADAVLSADEEDVDPGAMPEYGA